MPAALLLFCSLIISHLGWAQSFCVTKSKSILYESASSRSKELLQLEKWTPLQGIGKSQKGFKHVRTSSGVSGWIRSAHVSEGKSCVSVRVERSRLRSGPGLDYEAKELAKRGDVFLDLGGEDGWTKVRDNNGNEAWINLDHVWRPQSKMRMSFEVEP
jgi:SH3-like domain-containing protein